MAPHGFRNSLSRVSIRPPHRRSRLTLLSVPISLVILLLHNRPILPTRYLCGSGRYDCLGAPATSDPFDDLSAPKSPPIASCAFNERKIAQFAPSDELSARKSAQIAGSGLPGGLYGGGQALGRAGGGGEGKAAGSKGKGNHWSTSAEFSGFGNSAEQESMTISRKAFNQACGELRFDKDMADKLWLKLHEHCFLSGGEHITLGATPPREDARNVNEWHWDNANLMPWAKERLKQLLLGLDVPGLPDRGWIRITELKSVEGDCETNTRKGRVMVCFDMKVVVKWEGEVNYEEVGGTISMPYIDNVETEDGTIRTEVVYEKNKKSPSCPDSVRDIVDKQLIPLVKAQMQYFVQELLSKSKRPKKDVDETVGETRAAENAAGGSKIDGGSWI